MNTRQNVKLRPVQGLTQHHTNSFGLIYVHGHLWATFFNWSFSNSSFSWTDSCRKHKSSQLVLYVATMSSCQVAKKYFLLKKIWLPMLVVWQSHSMTHHCYRTLPVWSAHLCSLPSLLCTSCQAYAEGCSWLQTRSLGLATILSGCSWAAAHGPWTAPGRDAWSRSHWRASCPRSEGGAVRQLPPLPGSLWTVFEKWPYSLLTKEKKLISTSGDFKKKKVIFLYCSYKSCTGCLTKHWIIMKYNRENLVKPWQLQIVRNC